MSFQHTTQLRDGIAYHQLINSRTDESISLIPELGGTIASIRLQATGAPKEWLVFDDADKVRTNPLFRGRFLFPFNDRIPKARYTFDGTTHQLPVNSPDDGSAIHGFLHQMPMRIADVRTDEDAASMRLEARIAPTDFPGYPFATQLAITYVLDAKGVTLRFDIANPSQRPVPFALGWHPYFALDTEATTLMASYERFVEVDDALLPTRQLLPTAQTPLDFSCGQPLEGMSVDLGFTAPADGITRLRHRDAQLEIHQDTALFPYTQLYIPEDGRSIAIEPITAATNSFNFQELGLRVLDAGQSVQGAVRIRCHTP
ncbi:MAG: hypothetical protein M0R76_06490 [Proteobacteria bacterium]|nr:hypothetical protein [Pseudomonadota bacterium]